MPPIPDVAGGGYNVKRPARAKPKVKRKPQRYQGPLAPGRKPTPAQARALKPRTVRQRQEYAARPVEQRQAQLKSKGVLAPKYGKVVRKEHRRRVTQLKRDPAARKRLEQRQAAEAANARRAVLEAFVKATRGQKPLERVEKKDPTGQLALIRAQAANPKQAKGVLGVAGKIAKNVLPDAYELAVTTPSSIAKLASTAVTDPKKVPGMLIEPYKQLVKDPGKFITEKPVTTLLMVSPAGRVAGTAAGKAARVTGKQTLTRAPKTLPGTALKEQRTGSRDIVVRAIQSHKDKKRVKPLTMTVEPKTVTVRGKPRQVKRSDVQRRADEFYDFGRKHQQRVESSAAKEFQQRKSTRALPKAEREAKAAEHMSGVRGGAKRQVARRFAEEFGSTWSRTPQGAIVKPKDATKGVLHKTRDDAQAIANRITKKGLFDAAVFEIPGPKPASTRYAVVPKAARERLEKHRVVGTSPAIGAEVMRGGRHMFTQAVLPLSPRWLLGQGIEAGFRSAVAGAGPTSYVRGKRLTKAAEKEQKGLGTELKMRTMGGQFGATSTARDLRTSRDFGEGTDLATQIERAASPKKANVVRRAWRGYTNLVFDTVNGAMENTARTAMLGKAAKRSPLMDKQLVGLSDKALAEAARGLRGTDTQVALGRAVDRMYGQYARFGPGKRETLLHTTPFYPWYRNMVTFLTKTLPVDHPVKASLLASLSTATEDWRKANKISTKGERRPDFLLGMYPTGKDSLVPVGRYLPFLPADVTGATGDLVLPQFMGAIDNLRGVDWTGKRLKHPGYKGKEFNLGEKALRAAVSQAEALVPGVRQVGTLTGVTPRHVDKREDIPPLKARARRLVDPLTSTKAAGEKPKVKRKGSGWGGGGASGKSGWG